MSRETFLNAKWEKTFADLKAWLDHHGRLPRRRSSDTEEYRLANWLNRNRENHRHGNLASDHVQKLSTIPGALHPLPQPGPSDRVDAIEAFYKNHGRLPKNTRQDKEEAALARYLTVPLRSGIRNGTLPTDLCRRLAAIPGAAHSPRTLHRSPSGRLGELEEYVARVGQLPSDKSNPALYAWMCRASRGRPEDRDGEARQVHERILELRSELSVGPTRKGQIRLSPLRNTIRLKDLKAFVADQGHLPRNTSYPSDERRLNGWLNNVRRSRRTDQETLLAVQQIVDSVPRAQDLYFMQRLEEAEQVVSLYGRWPSYSENQSIRNWLRITANKTLAAGQLDIETAGRAQRLLDAPSTAAANQIVEAA